MNVIKTKKVNKFVEKHNLNLPKIEKLVSNSKKLNSKDNLWSFRIKDKYRIIWKFEDNKEKIKIINIGNRSNIYNNLK